MELITSPNLTATWTAEGEEKTLLTPDFSQVPLGGDPIISMLHTMMWPKRGQILGVTPKQLANQMDWCQGCDGLWEPWAMGWTDLGLYRCTECR